MFGIYKNYLSLRLFGSQILLEIKWIDMLQELIKTNLDTRDARMPPM